MRRKIIIGAVIVVVLGLLVFGIRTGVLTGKILPALGKIAKAVPPKMWIGLGFKFLILTGLMGWITKLVNARKERFVNGENEYQLVRDYSLVVGYDFQTKPLLKRLLSDERDSNWTWRTLYSLRKLPLIGSLFPDPGSKVLLITNRDVRTLRAEMSTELTKMERERLLYMRRDLAIASAYAGLRIRGAKVIYVMGDEGVAGRDGVVLRACEMIANKISNEHRIASDSTIRAHVQFADPGFYAQMRDHETPLDGLCELDIFNYYDSWVWKCWSQKDSVDDSEPQNAESYLPIRFKPDADRNEVFVIGSGPATRAVVDSAITLMNYGADSKCNRLTVVTDRTYDVLPPDDAIREFPELEIVSGFTMRDLMRTVASAMCNAASDEKCAVTIVITEDSPEKAVKTYLGLPFALRCKEISVLLWMGAQSRNLPAKRLIKVAGDKVHLRYFGMLNCMPWLDPSRFAGVIDINYYWSVCTAKGWPLVVFEENGHFTYRESGLVDAAKQIWDENDAHEKWQQTKRWAKWSNINSAGSCKEKAALIHGRKLDSDLLRQLLKAEHNRWWSERLLSDWRYAMVRDNASRLHPNMIPFEKLDAQTQDLDKINIAVMARQGFIG